MNSTSKQKYLHLLPSGEEFWKYCLWYSIFGPTLPRIYRLFLAIQNIWHGKQTLSNILEPTPWRRSNFSIPIKWLQGIVLMWFILILLVDSLSNTRSLSISSKNPLFFAFSSRRNKPALDVRFLAAKSILLITIKSLFASAALSTSIFTCERCESWLIQPFYLSLKRWRPNLANPYNFRLKVCVLSVFWFIDVEYGYYALFTTRWFNANISTSRAISTTIM